MTFGHAQPRLPEHWFQERAPAADGEAISFCVDPRDPGHPVDAAIAEAIAEALLTNVRLHVVGSGFEQDDFDDLYFELIEHCAVYMGFRLYAEAYPEWLTFTRSFYEARFVLLATEPWRHLDDIPLETPIGVVQGTLGDIRFLLSNNSKPASQRRPRHPLGRPTIAFDALMEGRVGALVVWEPWWWWLRQQQPELADLHVVQAPVVSEPPVGVGAVLTADRTFIRATVDQAIAALVADGVIQTILDEFDYPGQAPSP
jgi:polar amino acid transport system substrate-binding protein